MEYNIKKKPKLFINIKTNNFIQQNQQKDAFFNQLLTTLNQQLDPKQFAFLTTCILHKENPVKKSKNQSKIHTTHKISTQPDERIFNINEIDPTIFQQRPSKKFLKPTKNIENHFLQLKSSCVAIPRERIKEVVFQNKRILNLDKKLAKKYYQPQSTRFSESFCSKNSESSKGKFFIPKFQGFLASNRTRTQESQINPISKMSIKRFKKDKMQKNSSVRRLKTSFGQRDYGVTDTFDKFQISKFRDSSSNFKDISQRKSQFFVQNLDQRKITNFVPQQFMDRIIFSRKQSSRQNKLNRDLSDNKLQSKYKKFYS